MIKKLAIRKMVAIEFEGNAKFDLFQFLLKLFIHIQTLSYTENSKKLHVFCPPVAVFTLTYKFLK